MNTLTGAQHGRPAAGAVTERVWAVADEIGRDAGRKARRKEVVDAYVAEGGNANTASTQFHYWSRATSPRIPEPGPGLPDRLAPQQLLLEAQGRVAIPPALLAGMEVGRDGKVTAHLVDGALQLVTLRVALRQLRAIGRSLAPDGGSVVDEFIAERHREAELE